MKTISWSIAFGLAAAIPALAAPSGNSGGGWNNEGSNEAKKFGGWGTSSPFKPGFNKPGSPSNSGPTWDGTCGGKDGRSCDGSWAGQCCSKDGQCGSTNLHCGGGCQAEFGKCAAVLQTTSIIAPVPSSYQPSIFSSIMSSLSSESPTAEVSTVDTSEAGSSTTSSPESASFSLPTASSSAIDSTASACSTLATVTVTVGGSSGTESSGSSTAAAWSSAFSSETASVGSAAPASSSSSSVSSSGSSAIFSSGFSPSVSTASSSITWISSTATSSIESSPIFAPTSSSTGSLASASLGSSISSSAGSSGWSGSTSNTTGAPSSYPGSPPGYPSGFSSGFPITTGLPGTGSSSLNFSSIGVVSTSTGAGVSVVTSPTLSPSLTASLGFGNGTSSIPITTSTPITSSPVNVTKPTNTTSACTTKPTPQCIPCEGAPDPAAPWCGYDINTDFYKSVPRTCKTVEYDFVVTNTTIAPDGISRMGLLINGQMPGPAIEANWGDTVVVRLTNNLPAEYTNGTTLHFHGIRQNYTNEMDGVPSITQCPLAPGESMTYTWIATQYGTSWYHSHFQLQAWEGIMGPIVIHGPSSAAYDVDLGPIILQDWSHQTVDEMYDGAQDGKTGGPRVLDTGLINGMNVFGADGASNQTGKRYQLEFNPGKKHLLRVVNTAIQSTFKFYIDGHKFQVISTDFVPIKPYTTNILNINIGQRYEIIVEADQPVGDYWMRSDNQDACAVITNAKNIKGIVHYAGGPGSTPTSVGYNYTSACVDEPLSSLVPVVPYTVGASNTEYDETVVVSANNSLNLYRWYLYGTTSPTPETFQSEWSDPTLYEIWKNNTVPPYSGGLALKIPKLQEWVYIVIESPIPLPHPIHLHGHDFFVLGSGNGTYDSGSSPALNLNNPPRRDVALLPTAGYLVLAFQTDNPGVWLMHCHIGWHTSMGFSMQIVEAQDLIKPAISDTCLLDKTCKSWRSYATSKDLTTPDSGV